MPSLENEVEDKFSSPRRELNFNQPLILSVLFLGLFGMVLGVGSLTVLTWNTNQPLPKLLPTPTPTPDPRVGWKSYQSELYGINLKIPQSWKAQEGGIVGDSQLYLQAGEALGNLRYYISITSLPAAKEASIAGVLEEEFGPKKEFTKKQIDDKEFYITVASSPRQTELRSFLPDLQHQRILSFALTPYDKKQPLREQQRYETIFYQILSTLKITSRGTFMIPSGKKENPQPTVPQLWKVYNDVRYAFSFEYPPDYTMDTSRQGRINLNNQFEILVTSVDPAKCHGVCPVREKESSVTLEQGTAKKYEGYLTSEGGNTPQRFLQYVFNKNNQYYMFTLYELPFNSSLPKNRSPQPIDLSLVKVFEEIIDSVRFNR